MGDIMLLSELQTKDIVNLSDGNKIGKIKDIDIDVQTGDVVSINVLTVSKLRSFFSGESCVVIHWERVVKFGGEVIIVNLKSE